MERHFILYATLMNIGPRLTLLGFFCATLLWIGPSTAKAGFVAESWIDQSAEPKPNQWIALTPDVWLILVPERMSMKTRVKENVRIDNNRIPVMETRITRRSAAAYFLLRTPDGWMPLDLQQPAAEK